MTQKPSMAVVAKLDTERLPARRVRAWGRKIYLHLPNGMGRSKCPATSISSSKSTTVRNWNTSTSFSSSPGDERDPTRTSCRRCCRDPRIVHGRPCDIRPTRPGVTFAPRCREEGDRRLLLTGSDHPDFEDGLYRPPGAGPFPVVVAPRWGVDLRSATRVDVRDVGMILAAGIAYASIDYRLVPAVRFPAPIDDVACAVRFIRAEQTCDSKPITSRRWATAPVVSSFRCSGRTTTQDDLTSGSTSASRAVSKQSSTCGVRAGSTTAFLKRAPASCR